MTATLLTHDREPIAFTSMQAANERGFECWELYEEDVAQLPRAGGVAFRVTAARGGESAVLTEPPAVAAWAKGRGPVEIDVLNVVA